MTRRNERHNARCHATTPVEHLDGVFRTTTNVTCHLAGGHEGPHETRVNGKLWQFPKTERDFLAERGAAAW